MFFRRLSPVLLTIVLASLILLTMFCYKNWLTTTTAPQDTDRVETRLKEKGVPVIISRPLPPGACSLYGELRDVNFLHTSLKNSICKDVPLFTVIDSAFPPCELQPKLPELLTEPAKSGSFLTYLRNPVTRRNVTSFVYSGSDLISNAIRSSHIFEESSVQLLLQIIQKLNSNSPVTFLDIGSNIGVFALTALDLGVPVVALDANIRNLMRVKLSAEASGVPHKLRLVWNFVSSQVSLMYLNFPQDCNIGGATKFGRAVVDTIPVMSTTADSIISMIETQTVVMKVDIEGGEAAFFKSAEGLFSKFTIPIVHMEWLRRHMSEDERKFMVDFFLSRRYSPRDMRNLNVRTNIEDSRSDFSELVWIHEDAIKSKLVSA